MSTGITPPENEGTDPLAPESKLEGTDPLAPESKLEDTFLSTIDKVVKRLVKRDKVTRRVVTAMVVSFVLDISLTIVIAVVLGSTTTTQDALKSEQDALAHQAAAIHQNQISACGIGNQLRKNEINLWNELVVLSAQSSPPAGQTPAQKAASQKLAGEFLAYVGKTFAPVDCQKIYAP